jgi:hypothetical protein
MLEKNGIRSNVTCLADFSRAENAKKNGLLLVRAVVVNDRAAMAALIVQDADVNIQDELGRTPLHYAAINGSQDACDIIIGSGRCNSTINDVFDKYASDLAFEQGKNYKLWRKLLSFELKQAQKFGVKLVYDEDIKFD